jgi:amidohydrolase
VNVEELKQKVTQRLDEIMPELVALSDDIFAHPELKFEEHHAKKVITELLEKFGMEVDYDVANLPTAFAAHVPGHRSNPRVGILSEYDALPEIGHACGHNLIGTSGVGAFLVLASIADELDGSVSLYGTPGEEGGGGKITMLEADSFDGLDTVMMTHPIHTSSVVDNPCLASTGLTLQFHGRPSHAATAPQHGINAVDALVNTYVAVNGMRQRMPNDVNICGIITHGGSASNIIPDYAEMFYNVRADSWQKAKAAVETIKQIAEGSAAAIGATVESDMKKNQFAEFQFYTEDKQNDALKDVFRSNLDSIGIDVVPWNKEMGVISTDFANLSLEIPGMHLMLKLDGTDSPPHTREFAEAAGSENGRKWLRYAILAMAFSTIDVLNSDQTLKRVQSAFAVAAD